MEKIIGNEPAMPFTAATKNTLLNGHLTGLTIRQHFAAMALIGILSNSDMVSGKEQQSLDWASDAAVKHADALINALNQNP